MEKCNLNWNFYSEDNAEKLPVVERVKMICQNHSLLPADSPAHPLLVGFSGGADSLALLLILHELGVSLRAVHFHHNLRGAEADADAEWCADFCSQQGLPFECRYLDTPAARKGGESLEQAARRLRLQQWRELAGADQSVALGHHADDCLETLLLRLARGSNVSGLTGLRSVNEVEGVRFIRPLLTIRRQELEAYLADRGITDWRVDTTNQHTEMRRNAIRHQWLPLMCQHPGADIGLFRSMAVLREDADFIDSAARREVEQFPEPRVSRLRQLHPALLARVLRYYLSRQAGKEIIPRGQALVRLRGLLTGPGDGGSRKVPMEKGIEVIIQDDRLYLNEGEYPEKPTATAWKWRECPELNWQGKERNWRLRSRVIKGQDGLPEKLTCRQENTACFPLQSLPETLTVRPFQPGDRMIPFGHSGSRKVKDIFSQAGVPIRLRRVYPIVCAEGRIIWIPAIKRSSFAPLDASNLPAEIVRLEVV